MTGQRAVNGAVTVRRADARDVAALTPLFDGYRLFYDQPSDHAGARAFLRERIERGQSTVLVATMGDEAVGFTQLYPTFSSVSMAPVLVLNDLFVRTEARARGVGRRLLRAAIDHARDVGACRIELSTAVTNEPARALYLALGFVVDREFDHLSLPLAR